MNRAKKFFADRAHTLFTTPDTFRAFLLQQNPDAIVGTARDTRNCPLATFAKVQGFPVTSLTFGHLDIDLGKPVAVLGVNQQGFVEEGILDTEDAYWYFDFVNLVDRLHEKETPITAARALLLLNTLLVSDVHPDELTEADLTHEVQESAKVVSLTVEEAQRSHWNTCEHNQYALYAEGKGCIHNPID